MRRALRRAWRRARFSVFVVAGVAVLGCWLAAVVSSVPPREAVRLQQRGEEALAARQLRQAERTFMRVLSLAPRSGSAHRGLACSFWARGRRDAAAVQLVLAIQAGMPFRSMTCGRLGDLTDHFDRHVAAIPVVYVLPRTPRSRRTTQEVSRALESVARTGEAFRSGRADGARMLAAACVAWRGGYRELAYQYAELSETWDAGRVELHAFLTCLGPRSREISCAPAAERLSQCAFRADLLRAMQADRRYGRI